MSNLLDFGCGGGLKRRRGVGKRENSMISSIKLI
jgi:hypothetical protein